MRRLFLAASALTLFSLAACGRHAASTDSAASAPTPSRQAADTTPPPARPVTQASAVIGGDAEGGAYGMPRAPIPYNALGAYERQWNQGAQQVPPTSTQPGQPPAQPQSRTTKPRSADTVFY